MKDSGRIHIVGGGIAGLTTAIALRYKGFPVTLFEQASAFSDVGAGITLGPNASRVLMALGLEERLQPYIRTPRHVGTMLFDTGERLSYKLRGKKYIEEFGAPFWHIHRADLLHILVAVITEDEGVEIKTGHQALSVEQDAQGVLTKFANGKVARSDLLIACDGIKSTIRSSLFRTAAPEFTGYVAWRGLVNRSDLPELELDPDFALYVGPKRMFARYPVRQGNLINYVAIATEADWVEEGWAVKSELSEVLREFDAWCEDVTDIIKATPEDRCYKWALHVRQPLDTWIKGRVVLLGDAAHPMTPFLGLGAGIGIEDAMVLARALDAAEDQEQGLLRYEKVRLEHANQAQLESAKQGLHLLDNKPDSVNTDKRLNSEDSLGLYQYDATSVAV